MLLRLSIGVRNRVRIALALLGALGALALAADVYMLSPAFAGKKAAAASRGLTPRQVILGWFDAWNANDARRVCSLYGEELLARLGGSVNSCAAGYGQLAAQRFQIASIESEGEMVTVGVIAGVHGGAVYLAREYGAYKIVGFRA